MTVSLVVEASTLIQISNQTVTLSTGMITQEEVALVFKTKLLPYLGPELVAEFQGPNCSTQMSVILISLKEEWATAIGSQHLKQWPLMLIESRICS